MNTTSMESIKDRTTSSGDAVQARKRPIVTFRNSIWSVPVGLQLSLIYALLFSATLALLGWALYSQLEGFLVQNTAQRLDRLTQPILVRSFPPRHDDGRDGGKSPGGDALAQPSTLDQAASTLVQALSGPDIVVAVLDSQGVIIKSTSAVSGGVAPVVATLPAQWLDSVKSGTMSQTAQWIATSDTGERLLVVLTPLTLQASDGSASTPLYLEQITSLAPADAVLSQLKLYILLGIIVGTAIGVVAGLALTRVVLHPLDRMVGTAEAIAGGDLDRRLHLPSGRNEVARLGSAFDHMVDRLGATLEAQRRFVADASHELRTPLTSLEGMSEMLLMGADRGDTGVVQRMVRSMHTELARMGRLVTDLLTLSRLDSITGVKDAAATTARFVPTDLSGLLDAVHEQMAPAAEACSVRLVSHADAPVMVNGEPDRLKQVLLNLVDNALRYTPEGGQVTLLASHDPSSGTAQIQVQDTGSGIALNDLPHIFDRFYRGDLSRARATGNSGLGLAIVHGIVEAHGGSIAVRSTVGEGTCFTITLPVLFTAPVASASRKSRHPQEAVAPTGYR